MNREEIKKIIKEETEAFIIGEGIIDSLLMIFLSPKLKRDVKKLKDSPDWQELVQKINTTRDEMNHYNDRFEKYLKLQKKDELEAKQKGYKYVGGKMKPLKGKYGGLF